jgi:DNA-binding response OmpR family regulator
MKILFAGVNPALVALLKTVLSSAGSDVIVASDGRGALDTFCTEHVDLILMEIDVPVMSGLLPARSARSRRCRNCHGLR